MPALHAPVDLSFDTGTHSICATATAAPSGQVALLYGNVDGLEATLFSSSGTPQSDVGAISGLQDTARSDLDVWFHWVNGGWQGIVHDVPALLGLETWNTAGVVTGSVESVRATASAPDGKGGTVLVGVDAAGSGQGHLTWIGADGAIRRDVLLDRAPWRVIVAWGTDHVLVFSTATPGNATARWFGTDGSPLTPWFDARFAPASADSSILAPMIRLLLDGRPVAFDGNAWVAAYRDGATTIDAPPSWLASHAGKRLAVLPGGRGYALLGGDLETGGYLDGTTPDVELLTPDGQSCGKLTVPPGPAPAAATRLVFGYFVGLDGTLIEGSYFTGSVDLGMGIHCAFRWWPQVLGR